jgi:hypothetical protein
VIILADHKYTHPPPPNHAATVTAGFHLDGCFLAGGLLVDRLRPRGLLPFLALLLFSPPDWLSGSRVSIINIKLI